MAVFSGPEVVNDGLVLHLDAANDRSYSGSGTAWSDLSGNGNNGTLINGVGYSSNNKGYLSFDGIDDRVNIPNPLNQVNNEQEWTVFGWIDVSNTNTNQFLISGINFGLRVNHVTTTRPLLYLHSSTNDYYIYGETNKILGKGWLQITFVFRNSDGLRKIYLNTIDISAFGPNKTSTPYGISSTLAIGNTLIGNISQIQIYNRVLTEAEIKQNFEATRSRYGI